MVPITAPGTAPATGTETTPGATPDTTPATAPGQAPGPPRPRVKKAAHARVRRLLEEDWTWLEEDSDEYEREARQQRSARRKRAKRAAKAEAAAKPGAGTLASDTAGRIQDTKVRPAGPGRYQDTKARQGQERAVKCS